MSCVIVGKRNESGSVGGCGGVQRDEESERKEGNIHNF